MALQVTSYMVVLLVLLFSLLSLSHSPSHTPPISPSLPPLSLSLRLSLLSLPLSLSLALCNAVARLFLQRFFFICLSYVSCWTIPPNLAANFLVSCNFNIPLTQLASPISRLSSDHVVRFNFSLSHPII